MKKIIVITVLLLFLVLFYSIFLTPRLSPKTTSPTPTITSAPQSEVAYENKNLGYSFRYPENWQINSIADTKNFYLTTPSNNRLQISIVADNSKTIAEFLQKQDKISTTAYEGQPSKEIQSTKSTKIAGLNCIQREEYLIAADMTVTSTYFKNKNYFISFTLQAIPGNTIDLDKPLYQQILSTIKFN